MIQGKGKNISRFIRSGAVLLSLLLLFTILFSHLYVALEADHECDGDHCHICETIERCEAVLHEMQKTVSRFWTLALGVLVLLISASLKSLVSVHPTPVSRKVQLNN